MAWRMVGGIASSAAPVDESKDSPNTGPSEPPPLLDPLPSGDEVTKVEEAPPDLAKNSAALELERQS